VTTVPLPPDPPLFGKQEAQGSLAQVAHPADASTVSIAKTRNRRFTCPFLGCALGFNPLDHDCSAASAGALSR
jgi:hypothetical protein